MQCKKCGYENMEGVQVCQKCGAPFGQAERRSSELPMWFGSRIIGVLVVLAGALALLGVFLPWAKAVPGLGVPPEAVSAAASGWNLMMGSGDVQDGAEPYAILVFAGGILLLLGAVWALIDPNSKTAWATTAVAGLMVIAGSAWAWVALGDYVFAGVEAIEHSISHGVGLYLTIGGGVAGVLAGVVGRLGASEQL